MLKAHFSENYLDIITKPFYKIDISLDEYKFKSVLKEIQKNRHLKKYHILIFEDNSIGKKYLIDDNEKFFGIDKTVCSHEKNDSIAINFSTKSLKSKNLFTTKENLEKKEKLLLFYIISQKEDDIKKLIIENFNIYECLKEDIDYAVKVIEKSAQEKQFEKDKEILNLKKSLIIKSNEISFETICKFFLNQNETFPEGFGHKKNILKVLINNEKRNAYFYVFFANNQFYIEEFWESEESSDPALPVINKERTFTFDGRNGQYNLKQTIFGKHTISKENYNFINQYLKEFDNITENDAELLLINLDFDLHNIGKNIDINVNSKELLENLIYFK